MVRRKMQGGAFLSKLGELVRSANTFLKRTRILKLTGSIGSYYDPGVNIPEAITRLSTAASLSGSGRRKYRGRGMGRRSCRCRGRRSCRCR
jgi:hypothetical protein